jgi:tubulin-specific chaperone A
MPPPSQLSIATGSVTRLIKEQASYYKELEQQLARMEKITGETEDENAEFILKQEVRRHHCSSHRV